MRLLHLPGKNVGAVASDGRRVVACEVRGHTHVASRRTGETYRLHVEESAIDALIDGDVLYLVGGRAGAIRAVGLVAGETRAAPALTGAEALRRWSATPSERGLVASHFDGYFRTYDAQHHEIAKLGTSRMLEAFDARGTTLVAAYEGDVLRAYDCRTGEERHAAAEVFGARILGVHLDDAGLVTTSDDDHVRAYDADLRHVRTTRIPDHLGALRADPSDPRVLHAVGPEAVVRLDRETLEVLDRMRVVSLHQALCVDPLGRLLGVDGGLDVLDPLPLLPAPDPEVPDVEARYDRDATFDKDIPGMCATAVEVWQDARRITVCSWYHEEGSRKGDVTVRRGHLKRVEGTLVHIAMDDGTSARFDLTTRRLV